MSSTTHPTIDDVHAAATRLAGVAHRTPLTASADLSRAVGAEVRLKLESTQDTRSCKVRGAGNVLLGHGDIDPDLGVVTYSTGNHGRAVAHVGRRLDVPVTVCMSHNTTPDKRSALERAGARLELVGESQDEAAARAIQLSETGYALVDPIDDPATTAGHGTIGLEIAEDWIDVDTVVVPVSGGALIAGVALAVKALTRDRGRGQDGAARVIGVSMDRGAAMHESLQAGRPVTVPEVESLADSLQGGIGLENTHTFDMVRELVDELVLVTETEIAVAMAEAAVVERLVLEGAGAAPIAAVLFRDRDVFGDRIALVATGGVVDFDVLAGVVTRHRSDAADLVGAA